VRAPNHNYMQEGHAVERCSTYSSSFFLSRQYIFLKCESFAI
jgi:hypothetical protein